MSAFLFRLHQLAQRLQWLRPWCVGLCLLGVALVVTAVLDAADRHDTQLRLGMLLTLWTLMLFTCLQCFRQIPPPVLPQDPFFVRLATRLRLWLYHGLALAVALLGLILFGTSIKLLATT